MKSAVAAVFTSIVVWVSIVPVSVPAVTGDERSIEIAQRMIEAHGGMDKWQTAPTVSFTDELIPAGATSGLKGRVTVEQGARRVYIEYPSMDMQMGWDGEQAWGENWSVPYPPRFLAQLNYYFLDLPWLTMDDGVILGPPGKGQLWDDPVQYLTVRMDFEPGVGDTPNDYYVLYIHPDNYLLKGCKYIVTYRSLLPEGTEATPEHVLIFDRYKTVEGLVVPVHYSIYELDHSAYATCAVENWSFSEPFDESKVKAPVGAVLDRSTP